ncbi:hypothetical protein K503DRAFT_868415 [Rhizopogon vinicolor AM-OR11-026]|uniref:YDG domain-containing protein n=1 Tax=Rhizopogon vinicolor AM-OR11-026 TaxID=1314800 RepID=A0A1B7MRM4_9AGAM|nr:hypothetical protein K503DRAFT_868415 [Rhizopogon vinicolor AM-OR11-026]
MIRGVPDVEGAHNSSNEEMEEDPEEIARRRERKELSDRASKLSQRFGHIPGVNIGATWNTREQCSFAGVHRPFMAGIHGKKEAGAFSIVISCHYEDDKDSGDTVIYTGAGGRQRWTDGSDGNPPRRLRLGPQIHDQSWDDWGNEALVTSRDTGNPVRVIRSFKGVSDYAPVEGYRYDGLYIVEHAWQEKNPQGLEICRYRLEASCILTTKVPGQPPIPLRSGISVDTSDAASTAATPVPQFSPAQSPVNVSPPPIAILTPLQRHKQRVMQEMQALEQLMGQSSSMRR